MVTNAEFYFWIALGVFAIGGLVWLRHKAYVNNWDD